MGSASVLVADDSKAQQEPLRRVAQSLGLQIEVVSDTSDPMVDILGPAELSRVALSLIKTIEDTMKSLCNTLASLGQPPQQREGKGNNLSHPRTMSIFYIHPPLGSLVVAVANESARQGQQRTHAQSTGCKKAGPFGA